MQEIVRGTRWLWLIVIVASMAALAPWSTLHADNRTDYLVQSLRTSKAFRVRAQAALGLGQVEPSPAVKGALGQALSDEHPAVRIAAVTSLGSIGDSAAVFLLNRAAKDKDSSVRDAAKAALRRIEGESVRGGARGDATYYVAVDKPGTKAKGVDSRLLASVQTQLTDAVSDLEGVELASLGQTPAEVKKVLEERRLKGFLVQGSVSKLEQTGNSTRAEVSLILASYPGREMRAMLTGKATVSGGDPSTRASDAIQGAITGAMRRLPEALRASR